MLQLSSITLEHFSRSGIQGPEHGATFRSSNRDLLVPALVFLPPWVTFLFPFDFLLKVSRSNRRSGDSVRYRGVNRIALMGPAEYCLNGTGRVLP